ncbi:hypothetical protein LMG19087_02971 [Ralstonia wenshanensis]|nr:hypothetical protein LMG19087_02971 [Ralstonia wenshanensis]
MQSCKANCGGAAKLSPEHAKKIADVLCAKVVADIDPLLDMPARLTVAREALTRELRLLAEVTRSF